MIIIYFLVYGVFIVSVLIAVYTLLKYGLLYFQYLRSDDAIAATVVSFDEKQDGVGRPIYAAVCEIEGTKKRYISRYYSSFFPRYGLCRYLFGAQDGKLYDDVEMLVSLSMGVLLLVLLLILFAFLFPIFS